MSSYRLLPKIIVFGLSATLLLPVVFTPFTAFPWHFGKTVLFQMAVEMLLVLAWFDWLKRKLPLSSPRPWLKSLSALGWVGLAFIGWFIISAASGVNFNQSWWGNQARASGIFTLLHFAAWYWLLKRFLSGAQWRRALGLNAVVAAIVALTIFYPAVLPAAAQGTAGGGLIGNRALAGGYLVLALGGTLLLLALSQRRAARIGAGAAALAVLGAILVNGSRGALLGVLAGGVGGLVLGWWRLPGRAKQWSAAGLLGVAMLTGSLWLFRQERWAPAAVRGLVNWSELAGSGTGRTRVLAWTSAWQGIKERPLWGWGWGNFDVVFNKYYRPEFLKFSFAETVWDRPHNIWLDVAVGSGLIGAALYLAWFGFWFYYLWGGLPRLAGASAKRAGANPNFNQAGRGVVPASPLTPGALVIIAGTVLAYLAQNFFLFDTSNSLLLLFFLLAYLAPGWRTESNRETFAGSNGFGLAAGVLNQSAYWVRRLGSVLVLLLLLVSLWRWHLLPLRASYHLSRAQRAGDTKAWGEASRQALKAPAAWRPETAIFLAERLVQLDKAGAPLASSEGTAPVAKQVAATLVEAGERYRVNPLFWVWAGQVYLVLGERVAPKFYQPAELALTRAVALSPRKQDMLFLLGRLYLLKKDFPQALAAQRQAVAAAPEVATAHWFLGLTLVASGDTAAGIAAIEQALALGHQLRRAEELYLIDLYAGVKKYDKVIGWYEKFLRSEPENLNWYVRLATAYALSGRKAEALQLVKQAVNFFPPLKAEAEKFIKEYRLEQ